MWRSRIPVRSTIHSSEVSSIGKIGVRQHAGRHGHADARTSTNGRGSRAGRGLALSELGRDVSVEAGLHGLEGDAMPFLMALGLEEPWQMIDTPRTPRSGAPPYVE